MMTDECRDRIVNHLRGRGWITIAELAAWIRVDLGLSTQQGDQNLRHLRLMGRLERRASKPIGASVIHYEYRVL